MHPRDDGWRFRKELDVAGADGTVEKETFGSVALAARLVSMNEEEEIEGITFVGLCTDICVISNALLAKAYLPETPVYVDAACCAGVTPKSPETSLQAMKMCQIHIL